MDELLAADPTNEEYMTEKEFVKEICAKHGDDAAAAEDHGSTGEPHDLNLVWKKKALRFIKSQTLYPVGTK